MSTCRDVYVVHVIPLWDGPGNEHHLNNWANFSDDDVNRLAERNPAIHIHLTGDELLTAAHLEPNDREYRDYVYELGDTAIVQGDTEEQAVEAARSFVRREMVRAQAWQSRLLIHSVASDIERL